MTKRAGKAAVLAVLLVLAVPTLTACPGGGAVAHEGSQIGRVVKGGGAAVGGAGAVGAGCAASGTCQ